MSRIVRAGDYLNYDEKHAALTTSLTVIALSTLKEPYKLVTSDLKACLCYGRSVFPNTDSPDFFPSSLVIDDVTFVTNVTTGQTIWTNENMDLHRLEIELNNGVNFNGCLIVLDGCLFATVLMGKKLFYLFDCYSRCDSGLSTENGQGCLIRFDKIENLLSHLVTVFCSEGDGRNFSFTYVNVSYPKLGVSRKRNLVDAFKKYGKKPNRKEYDKTYYSKNKQKKIRDQKEYYSQNLEERQKYQLDYYSQNLEDRQKYQLDYYSQNLEDRQKYQLDYYSQNLEDRKRYQLDYYSQNLEDRKRYQHDYDTQHREKHKYYDKQRYANKQSIEADVISKFFDLINHGPDYICCECERALYKRENTVVLLCNADIAHPPEDIGSCQSFDGNVYICKTCCSYLQKNKIPPLSTRNKLTVEKLPDALVLTALESYLVAQRKLFAKIIKMPKGGQQKLKGSVLNVPVSAESVANVLKPFVDKAFLLMLKYKRKLEYRSCVTQELIRPDKVMAALRILCSINPFYSQLNPIDFEENMNLLVKETESDAVNEDECESISITSTSKSQSTEISSQYKQDPRQAFSSQNIVTCAQSYNPIEQIAHSFDESSNVISVAPGEGKKPISFVRDRDVEYLAYPTLLPTGKFGLNATRPVPLSKSQYFTSRLLHHSGRFSSNEDYIFFAQSQIEQERLRSSVQIALRKTSCNFSASEALDKNIIDRLMSRDKAYRFMSKLPGTPAYWNVFLYDLLAMIRQLGTPQFWHTISCADLEWPDLYHVLSRKQCPTELADDEISQLTYEEKCALLNKDPVTVARHFQYRLECYMNEVVKSKINLLGGKVDYYAIKIEFQLRGSPHAHMLLWVNPHVILTKDTASDYVAYIDQIVSGNLPVDDDHLRELVEKYQTHRHTKSCRKKNSVCRYHFPKFPTDKTIVGIPLDANLPPDERSKILQQREKVLKAVLKTISSLESLSMSLDELLEMSGTDSNSYYQALSIAPDVYFEIHLERSVESVFVNAFSPTLLKAYRANIDLSPVLDPYGCIMYLASYLAKPETTCSSALSETCHRARELNLSAKETMDAISIAFINSREVSKQESVYRCLPMLYLRRIFPAAVFVDTNLETERVRMLRSRAELEELDPDSNDVYYSGVHAKYADRPTKDFKGGKFAPLNDICLAQFVSMYYRYYGKSDLYEYLMDYQPSLLEKEEDETEYQSTTVLPKKFPLMSSKAVYTLRKIPCVLRFHKFNFEKEPEKYYHHLLLLYLPWRSESELLGPDGTYFSKFNDAVYELVHSNRMLFESSSEELDRALTYQTQCNAFSNTLYDSVAPHARQENSDVNEQIVDTDGDDSDADPVLEAMSQNHILIATTEILSGTTTEAFRANVRGLNNEQRQLFQRMLTWFRADRKSDTTVQPPLIFLHGGGGVGKSHTIRSIAAAANKILKQHGDDFNINTVGLFALTGVASFNLDGGLVIDSALSMNRNIKGCLPAVSAQKLAKLRCIWMNLRLVIVDEVSMLSPERLYHLHQRLCEIKGLDYASTLVKLFAGVSVVLVGDLFQLPPVLAKAIFATPSSAFMAIKDLWREFQYVELTQLMRQKHGSRFGEVLSRLRVGTHTEEDIEYLRGAEINADRNDPAYPKNALHLFAEVETANNYNAFMLSIIESEETVMPALDIIPQNMPQQRANAIVTGKRRDTGGLESNLKLKAGARVMLTRNIDVTDGLVNGAIGTVVGFKVTGEKVNKVLVRFDNSEIGEKTRRMSSSFVANANNAVPIQTITTSVGERHEKGESVRRTQFPLVLAWGTTIHKAQGLTLDRVVIDFKTTSTRKFQPGQAYVALSRVKSFDGLHLLNFDQSQIKVNKKALEEVERLKLESRFLFPEPKINDEVQLLCLNIQGLTSALPDLTCDPEFQTSDIILLQESHITNTSVSIDIPGFRLCSFVSELSKFRSKVAYCRDRYELSQLFCNEFYQTVTITFDSTELSIASVYRPQNTDSSVFLESLKTLLQRLPNTAIIAGDFNLPNSEKPYSMINSFLQSEGFSNCVNWPTHIAGNSLDCLFTRIPFPKARCHSVYYSDHDAVLYRFKLGSLPSQPFK